MKNFDKSYKSMLRILLAVAFLAGLPLLAFFLNNLYSPSRQIASQIAAGEGALSLSLDPKAVKYKILTPAFKELSSFGTSIHLGLPKIITDEGQEVLLCDLFPTVDWIFSADGIAVAGEIPQIIVRSSCLVDTHNNQILGPPVPFQEILKQKPHPAGTLEVPGNQTTGNIQIYLRNGADYWPQNWTWTGLRFYGKDGQKSLAIDGYEIISVLGKPLELSTTE